MNEYLVVCVTEYTALRYLASVELLLEVEGRRSREKREQEETEKLRRGREAGGVGEEGRGKTRVEP